jgi:hypothetical protein
MSVGVFLAAAALAQAADGSASTAPGPSYGPGTPAPPRTAATVQTAVKDCSPKNPDPNGAIVVCVERPNGYRIDPDVLNAKKAKRQADTGGPRPPERYADTSCSVVGAGGCAFGPAINLLAAAATAIEIGDRLAKGQEIGSIFKTEPGSSEYQYYQLAKKERERKELEAEGRAYAAQIDAEEAAGAAAKGTADGE